MIGKEKKIETVAYEFYFKKIEEFIKKNLPVHISLKNGRWLNGYIFELFSDGFILNEFKEGQLPVFFNEFQLDGIEVFRKEEAR